MAMRTTATSDADGPLTRGLGLLEIVAGAGGAVRPPDLAGATGLARSAVDRLTATLVHLGYLRSEGRDLEAAPQLMAFGNAYLRAAGLPTAVQPHLDRLARTLNESVSLTVADGCDVRIVGRATPPERVIPLGFKVGDLLPADRTASGAVLAADWTPEQFSRWRAQRAADPLDGRYPVLPTRSAAIDEESARARFQSWISEAAEQGWALDDQRAAPGLAALCVAVRIPGGGPTYALNVLVNTSRRTGDELREHGLAPLVATAREMSDCLAATEDAAPVVPPAPYADAKAELGTSFLQALARGLAVLTALGSRRGGLTLNETAQTVGLSYPSTRRNLLVLRDLGYVEQRERRYRPTVRTLGLGYVRLSGLTLSEIADPHLAGLSARVRESASVVVLDKAEVRYLACHNTQLVTSARIQPGTRFPAYATATGRVLLADRPRPEQERLLAVLPPQPLTPVTRVSPVEIDDVLRQARDDGHAVVEQELETGLRSVAAPLRGPRGDVVAALNIDLHADPDSPKESSERLLPHLLAMARAIEADLAAVFAFVPLRHE